MTLSRLSLGDECKVCWHGEKSMFNPEYAVAAADKALYQAKRAGRNQRFLHFLARYNVYKFVVAYHTFTRNFPCRAVTRIVSASAPLPLIPTPNNASVSTVENVSGSGARGTDDASYVTTTTVFCERVV